MQLSVIIVNYNVRYFLEQALFSVRKAAQNIDTEVFVVDNNSTDGSCEMLAERFPEVKLIRNTENAGFSKANNQAILKSTGKYVLLLNPDTVVEEDTFSQILEFMEKTTDCGGLGVKMLDGTGKFLPESKRALPTPAIAFYKIFGLAALFPHSRTFGKYHLAYLDKDQVHEIEVLSGAFMLLRKEALDKSGLLDEDFFMYGEDIDLSYRILKSGYKNYYFPKTRIIHYKGESTKKTSVNYVFVFYKAMVIFARKHFSQKNVWLFSILINMAIYLRAAIAISQRFLKACFLPASDFLVTFLGFYGVKYLWERYIQNNPNYYPDFFIHVVVPVYVLTWIVSVLFVNGYEKPYTPGKLLRGVSYGTIGILVIYALIPETYRFSRALILLGACWAASSMILSRFMFKLAGIKAFSLELKRKKNVLIVGGKKEGERVLALLKQSSIDFQFSGFVKPPSDKTSADEGDYIGRLQDIAELLRFKAVDEVIFCAADLSSADIIENMDLLSSYSIEYKIAPPESLYIIGSNSIHSNGELYVIDINSVGKPSNRRNKRIFDISVSIGILILLPLSIIRVKKRSSFLKNIFKVISGSHTWVGYAHTSKEEISRLPVLRKPILTPLHVSKVDLNDPVVISRLNALYAKDYRIWNDAHILWKSFSQLGSPSV